MGLDLGGVELGEELAVEFGGAELLERGLELEVELGVSAGIGLAVDRGPWDWG